MTSPIFGGSQTLFDYNAYWLIALHDYVLASGDVGFARAVWPNVVRLIDGYYASKTLPTGLVRSDLGFYDYGYIRRHGDVVAYFNAQYAYALGRASELATWLGDSSHATAWTARAKRVASAFSDAFWDPGAGAFSDTTVDHATHPQDGNAFAALAGVASPDRTPTSGLTYLWNHGRQEYGNTFVDTQAWDGPDWGWQAQLRVYPFISYFEVIARFETGLDSSALALIPARVGLHAGERPEVDDVGDDRPVREPARRLVPSVDHGWSSGAAPALTNYALGVTPTAPGFGSYLARPHPGDLKWARGAVPTPHGPIHVYWAQTDRRLTLQVSAPAGTHWDNPPVRAAAGLSLP